MCKRIQVLLIVLLSSLGLAYADSSEGFIKSWLLCGPFPNPPNKAPVKGKPPIYDHTPPCIGLNTDYLTEHGGEANIEPVAGMEHSKEDGTKVAWFEHTSPVNKIIFRKAITKTPNVVAYAYTVVTIDNAGDYLLGLGSDEGVRVWINGKLVHDKLIERPIREDDDLIEVNLRKGENRILVKVEQGWGGWGFALRIVPTDEVFANVETDINRGKMMVSLRTKKTDKAQNVVLLSEGKPVATGMFKSVSGDAMAQCVLTIPVPPPGTEFGALDIVVNDEACGQVQIPSLDEMRARTFQWQQPKAYPGCVFTGTTFPRVDFEKPLWIETLIGPYSVSAVYYDANYNEVASAEKVGRYGAVAEIVTAGGDRYRRYLTLFRQADDVNWRDETGVVTGVNLPSGLGIESAVVDNQQDALTGFMKWRLASSLSEEPYAAVLLAGLHETTPDEPAATHRTGVEARNQKWWARLKDKLGLLEVPHLVFLPDDYEKDETKQWPLVLFLHGAGERGEDLDMLKRHGLPKLKTNGQDFPFIVVAPQCSLGSWWTAETENLAILLDRIVATYRVDTDRVYCTGLSMGGFGTWSLAMAYPERFAALAPICGGGDERDVARLKEIPIWAFHGAKDDTVPVELTQKLIDALKEIGATPRFTVYPDAYHNSWGQTYDNPELYEWMLKQKLSERKGGG